LSPLTTQYIASIAAVLQTLGLPDTWVSHSEANLDSSGLGSDSV